MSASTSTPSKRVAKKTGAAAPSPAPAAAPVAEVAAVAATTTPAPKAKRASKTDAAASASASAPVAAASASAPVVVSSSPVEQATTASVLPVTSLDDDLRAVASNLNSLRETAATLLGQVKKLEKRVHREMKDARKRRRRVKLDENGVEVKRAPSIFERPTQVTGELLTFLGRPAGTLMSRSEVTKAVNEYVKAHDLKNKHDIKPDAPLRALLAVGESEPLTYFNLQRYLNRHYVKAAPAVATA
jgi:chromatin remodeling complex protein RSC6